ncbi:MAG: ABC-F family ATP-binding cassette domain-containing protein [Patescibacteria group bacterium]
MLTLKNIRKIYGTQRVLEKVSFSVGEGQKIALVGQNGAGKSTLLRIIAGTESPDRGEILKPNRVLIGYLPQEVHPNGARMRDGRVGSGTETLIGYLRRMTGLEDLEREMAALEPRLDQPDILERYEVLRSDYERLGGYDFTRKAKGVLDGLMLSHIGFDRPVAELSGGEKRKAALAGVLLCGVDIMLLDEPTNNLDLPALLWLERYLNRSAATCIIASHDRRFLDNVVDKVLEIDWHRRDVAMYTGGWSTFAEMKAHLIRKHKEQYRMQEEERERLLVSAGQKMDWVERVRGRKAPDHDKLASHFKKERATKKFTMSAKVMEERQKRLNTVERPLARQPLIVSFAAKPGEKSSTITLRKVRFGYEDGFQGGLASPNPQAGGVGEPVDLKIPFGDRLAILGNNGAGKSTLLKTIAGVLPPLAGKRTCGKKLIFGYLMQEHENISRATTPLQLFKNRLGIYDAVIVAEHLAHFQFSPDILTDKIEWFSPGERVRLILALLSAMGANALVLDEPTNHLDLEAIEALEEALAGYAGTILLVTHDRRFLERIRLTKSYVLDGGKLTPVKNYETYAAHMMPQIRRILKRLEEKKMM